MRIKTTLTFRTHLPSHPYAWSGLSHKQKTNKIADIIRIKCIIKNFKNFCSSNRISDSESVFTVGLVATRSSKLDPMLICFDEFFFGPKSYPLHNTWVTPPVICKLPTLWTISFGFPLLGVIFGFFEFLSYHPVL